MPAAKRSSAKSNNVAKKRVIYFDQDRETKGTYRYAEVTEKGARGVMGTIWIQKSVAEELGCVESVKATIEADTDE